MSNLDGLNIQMLSAKTEESRQLTRWIDVRARPGGAGPLAAPPTWRSSSSSGGRPSPSPPLCCTLPRQGGVLDALKRRYLRKLFFGISRDPEGKDLLEEVRARVWQSRRAQRQLFWPARRGCMPAGACRRALAAAPS